MRLDILKRKNKKAILFMISIVLFLLSYRNCDRIAIRREKKLCVNRIFEKYPR